jgi:hypothetical protein
MHDVSGRAVERQRLPDDIRAATEPADPQPVADHERELARAIVRRRPCRAARQRHAEHVKQVRRGNRRL